MRHSFSSAKNDLVVLLFAKYGAHAAQIIKVIYFDYNAPKIVLKFSTIKDLQSELNDLLVGQVLLSVVNAVIVGGPQEQNYETQGWQGPEFKRFRAVLDIARDGVQNPSKRIRITHQMQNLGKVEIDNRRTELLETVYKTVTIRTV